MSVWEIIIGSVLIVFSLLIIAVVLLQEGRQANLGAIAGAADSFMEKGKARTMDALLAKPFFVLGVAGRRVSKFLS